MLKEIKYKIENEKLKYKNTIIIGDNSSGKSELLRNILLDKKEGYYFIDSVNRSFNYEKIENTQQVRDTYINVLEYRLEENIFNLKDSFDFNKTGMGFIEEVYLNFEEELKILIRDFLDINFDITIEDNSILGKKPKLLIDKNTEKLSSGYQAIIRIFLELLYFKNSYNNINKNPIVVIDEINEFLSTKNEKKILPFLMKKFNNMNFIITTHSADVIASSIDFNIIVLKGNSYECLDGNDFSTVTDAREIFEKIYKLSDNNMANDIEFELRNLLNFKISGTWTEKEETKLNKIEKEKLTNSQLLILNEIKSW
ncbi:MAG: hypothetical protein KH333_13065 [Clostridium sp.]|nr:hypothetical protein [Clostridium sp.]